MQKSYVSKPGCIEEVKSSENGKTSVSLSDVEGFLREEEAKKEFLRNPKDDYPFWQINYPKSNDFLNGDYLMVNSYLTKNTPYKVVGNVPLGSNFNKKLLWGDSVKITKEDLTDNWFVYNIIKDNCENNCCVRGEIWITRWRNYDVGRTQTKIRFFIEYFFNKKNKIYYGNTYYKNKFKFQFGDWDNHKGIVFVDKNGYINYTDSDDKLTKYNNNKIDYKKETFEYRIWKTSELTVQYGNEFKASSFYGTEKFDDRPESQTQIVCSNINPQTKSKNIRLTIGGGGNKLIN